MAKILVVEDNPDNMTLAVFLLQSVGHTVLCATDAEAGLTMAREEHPALILMDIQLPGMDGLEAIGLLKSSEATRHIPVIALTALAMKGDEERIRAAGCDRYIAKPMRYKEFLATIAEATGGAKSAPPVVAPRQQARILIVDDEPDNLDLLQVILAHAGFLPQLALSGPDALASVARERPDLILLDVMMPGMDGNEVVKMLKADVATAKIPIIMVTALDTRAARVLASSAGADDFVAKPLDRADLCARVNKLLYPDSGTLPRSA